MKCNFALQMGCYRIALPELTKIKIMEEIKMEGIDIDKKKPLWWVVLVTFCMVFIYSIGISPEIDDYADEFNPTVVENLNGVFS